MKPFLMALVALVLIAVGTNQILTRSGFSSANITVSPDSVRLAE